MTGDATAATDLRGSAGGRIFISVCEASADVHAAALVRAAREQLPRAVFYGLTGPRLRALGVETVYDFASHAAMLSGVLGVLGRAYAALRVVERSWRAQRPDVVVLLDSPELHLKFARRARALGIPVLYYIAPQTWASRAYRNRQIVRDIDRLACILPFEEGYFAGIKGSRDQGNEGFRAEFVGHPLFETLRQEHPDAATVAGLRTQAAGRPLVALLPGSRGHVIDTMLPLQLAVVRRLRAAGQDVHAVISCVSAEQRERIEGLRAADGEGKVDILVADNASLLTAADLVLVASGTATLHVAYYRRPMVVMYDAGRLVYWPYRLLRRWLLTTPHLSLMNILAGARIVPEFMPFVRDVDEIAGVARQLLTDTTWRALMTRQLDEIVRPLEQGTASARVCELIEELIAAPGGEHAASSQPVGRLLA